MNTGTITRPRLLSIALASLALATVGRADTDGTIRRTFEASPGGRLVVSVAGTRAQVEGTAGSQVEIVYTRVVSAGSEQEEAWILEDHVVDMSQSGDTVTIRAEEVRREGAVSWLTRLLTGNGNGRRQFALTIRVPREFDLDIRTSGGAIEVGGIDGTVQARTSGGSVRIADVNGAVEARTSGGSITLTAVQGDVSANTSGGRIEARDSEGSLALRTSGGGILVSGHRGEVDGRTSGGGISVALLSAPTGSTTLATSGGGITVTVPANAALEIDAATSGGGVSVDLPVAMRGEASRNRVAGTVNGGGPLLHLRTSGGGIRVNGSNSSTAAR